MGVIGWIRVAIGAPGACNFLNRGPLGMCLLKAHNPAGCCDKNAIPLVAGEILRIAIKGIRAIDAVATKLVCTIFSRKLRHQLSSSNPQLRSNPPRI